MTVTVADILDFFDQLLPTILAIVAVWVLFKKWLKRVATSSEETAAQVKTSNGKTLASYAESTARDVVNLKTQMNGMNDTVKENYDRSVRAEALAESAHRRLDNHLTRDHNYHVTAEECNNEGEL